MFNPSFIIQIFIGGILMGGIYSFIALGLTLIFGVMKVINFAHGALLMLGMYTSYWLLTIFGIDPYLSVFVTIPLFFVIGWLIQRFLIESVLDAPHLTQIVITLGLTMFLENIALFLWSPDFRSVQVSYQEAKILLGDISISFTRLMSFILAIGGTGALYLFLKGTDIGKAIRATADDKEGAILMGINYKQVYYIAFGIGAACVGMAGSFITPVFFVDPYIGGVFVLMAFVVVIMGGIGNFLGALICGLIVGVAESFGAIFMPGSMKRVLPFTLLIIIMLFKPTGLFGRRTQ
jgi:branched-chain amino acid transport system permease protein